MVMTVIGFRPVRPILNTASWQRSSGLVRLCYRFGPFVSSGPKGEQMTREEAEALGRATDTVTVFFTEIDLQL